MSMQLYIYAESDKITLILCKYYLVVSDCPTPMEYVGPYRWERYHLLDFRCSIEFANYNELFNYYHTSLRCTMKRTFGV